MSLIILCIFRICYYYVNIFIIGYNGTVYGLLPLWRKLKTNTNAFSFIFKAWAN